MNAHVEAVPDVHLQVAGKLVSQVFQRILALNAMFLNFVLVDVTVGDVELAQHVLRRQHLAEVEV